MQIWEESFAAKNSNAFLNYVVEQECMLWLFHFSNERLIELVDPYRNICPFKTALNKPTRCLFIPLSKPAFFMFIVLCYIKFSFDNMQESLWVFSNCFY